MSELVPLKYQVSYLQPTDDTLLLPYRIPFIMPSRLSRLNHFARLTKRTKAAKAAKGKDSENTRGADDAVANNAGAPTSQAAAPAAGLDQPPHHQHPVAAFVNNNNKPPAPVNNPVANAEANADLAAADVKTRLRAKRRSPHATPTAPPAPPVVCRLEGLPAELRIQVFSHISDLSDLRALMRASPVFAQQYYLDQKQILGQVLVRTLGSLFADAHAVQTSIPLYLYGPRYRTSYMVERFIHNYLPRRLGLT